MGGLKIVVALVAAIGGLGLLIVQKHHASVERRAIAAVTDARGFVEFDPPKGSNPDQVVILAAENCPHDGAVRADLLARAMSEHNVRFVRTSHAEFEPAPDDDIDLFVRRHNAVMEGEVPIVFVNGRVKSNPNLDEVLAEYENVSR